METKVILKKNGKRETYYRSTCPSCYKDKGFVRKSRVDNLCPTCSGRQIGLSNKGKVGPNIGKTFSAATRQKMSKAKIGKAPWNKGQQETRPEVLGKMSQSRLGVSPPNKGIAMTDEQRIKLSCSLRSMKIEDFSDFSSPKLRYQNEIQFRLRAVLRARLTAAIKNVHKGGSAVDSLGCSISELIQHIENRFQPGMTWDNWSRDGWHIDHIQPLSSFDLADPVQLAKACHYTNLRPLWAKDNLTKNDSIIKTVYVVTGAPGAGKSWVLSQLTNLTPLDTDIFPKSQWIEAVKTTNRPAISITIKVSSFIKQYPELDWRLVVIDEPLNVIQSRILQRGGTITPTLERRYRRMQQLKKLAVFSGSSSEVLAYLQAV